MNISLPLTAKQGAFAIVVKIEDKAFKLFFSKKHPNHKSDNIEDDYQIDLVSQKVFESEKEAYEIIQKSDSQLLKRFTPKYFGTVQIDKVFNPQNEDVTDHYLTDCCLVIEFIEGENEEKLVLIEDEVLKEIEEQQNFTLKEVYNEFEKFGIMYHNEDGSAIWNREELKIIDFGTKSLRKIECEVDPSLC